MKFKELEPGQWFTVTGNSREKFLKFNNRIEDKWGNVFACVSDTGRLICEDLDDTVIFPCHKVERS